MLKQFISVHVCMYTYITELKIERPILNIFIVFKAKHLQYKNLISPSHKLFQDGDFRGQNRVADLN